MGMSPKEYIIKLRLDRSMELLQCTDLSVGEISDIVGYQDPLYFSKLFKRKLGVSPAAYRKGNK
jgi:AraC-like DNA-binding protein